MDHAPAAWSGTRWFFDHSRTGDLVLQARAAMRDQGAKQPVWFYMAPATADRKKCGWRSRPADGHDRPDISGDATPIPVQTRFRPYFRPSRIGARGERRGEISTSAAWNHPPIVLVTHSHRRGRSAKRDKSRPPHRRSAT